VRDAVAITVRCPECGKPVPGEPKHAGEEAVCPHCRRIFVPAEDCGVPCPGCGELVVMSPREARRGMRCPACGYKLGGGKKWETRLYAALAVVTIAVAFLCFTVFTLAAGKTGELGESVTGTSPEDNEMRAVMALCDICLAQDKYHGRYGIYTDLFHLGAGSFIPEAVADAWKPESAWRGYCFLSVADGHDHWACLAVPARRGETGMRSFYMDETASIRHAPCLSDDDGPPGPESLPLRSKLWQSK
jgi:DNA-directed RNA polymerase subunit RPC12/RpoP